LALTAKTAEAAEKIKMVFSAFPVLSAVRPSDDQRASPLGDFSVSDGDIHSPGSLRSALRRWGRVVACRDARVPIS